MFDNDKRFIGEEDAMQYYMGESTKAFARFSKALDNSDVTINMRAGTFLYGMPEHLTDSICDNSISGPNSRLKGHFKRDVVRNISQAVVFDFYADQIESYGKILFQVAYDAKGNPIGDAANIAKSIVNEMQSFDNAYGQDGEVEVNSSKIEFSAMPKEAVVATAQTVKRMAYMSEEQHTPVQ